MNQFNQAKLQVATIIIQSKIFSGALRNAANISDGTSIFFLYLNCLSLDFKIVSYQGYLVNGYINNLLYVSDRFKFNLSYRDFKHMLNFP